MRPVALVDEFHMLPGADYEQVLGEMFPLGGSTQTEAERADRAAVQ